MSKGLRSSYSEYEYGCTCDLCIKSAARILQPQLTASKVQGESGYVPFFPDFSKLPWPDELAKKIEEEKK